MLRQFPFPYRHVVTFDSDVDRQEPWHGAAIHRLLNERLGLNISDSCWVMAARSRQSAFYVGADLNTRLVPEERDIPAWRLLLREWHRGNIDHFHSWYDDGTYLLRYPVSGSVVKIPAPPQQIGSAVYRVLRLVVPSVEYPKVANITLWTDDGDKIAYRIESSNRTTRVASEDGQIVRTIELVLGLDKPQLGNSPRSWTLIRKIDLGDCTMTLVELDNLSRRLLELQAAMMERLNVRPVYISSHGGKTCAQNFGELQIETKGRFDGFDAAIVRERKPQADTPGSHSYHADLLSTLGTEVIWPQMWGRFREFSHDMAQGAPEVQTWGHGLNAGWRSHVTVDTSNLLDADSFGEALERYIPGSAKKEIEHIYAESHEGSGLTGRRVVTGHGSAVPMLLYASLSMAKAGTTAEHSWYTHFGSHRDNRTQEINCDQPFTSFCVGYWHQLAEHAYGVGTGAKIWTPATGSYFRYKIAKKYLAEAISRSENDVHVEARIVEATGKRIPDPRAGSRDLHGLTVYVESSQGASLKVDGVELACFSRNAPDETGKESITILDDHCGKPILDKLPAHEIGRVNVTDAAFYDLASRGSGSYLLSVDGPSPRLRILPTDLKLWNTSHVAFRFKMNGPGNMMITLAMEGRAPIVIGVSPPASGSAGAFWQYWNRPGWQEHWLSVGTLEMLRKPAADTAFPVPVGKVEAVEFALVDAASDTTWELDWFRAYRACPDAIAPDGHLILGGRVVGPDGPIAKARITARSEAGQRWLSTSDRYGCWLLDDMPAGSIVEVTCEVDGYSCRSTRGRYIDLRNNEVEVDFVLR